MDWTFSRWYPLLLGLAIAPQAFAQDLPLREFAPKSNLNVPATLLEHARYPAIDCHTHFGFRLKGDFDALNAFVETMDQHHIALCTSLDAQLGSEEDHLAFLRRDHANRFLVFAHIDFRGQGKEGQPTTWACNQPGFIRTCCEQLTVAKAKGIVGVKFFKQFGLGYRDANGDLIQIDNPRFDPIWKRCGDLQLPVIIHTGDPAAFFLPIDKANERYEELARHPEWSFYGDEFPSRNALLEARNRVIAKHPNTTFIGAHLAGNPEDLATVATWLEQYPNLYVELASRIGELGRQPYTSRDFIVKYSDRVLFGTDGPWPELRIQYYWRFLETRDEYFPYSEKQPPPQGFWNIYGLGLPDDVLKKIYFENYLRLIPTAQTKYASAAQKMHDATR